MCFDMLKDDVVGCAGPRRLPYLVPPVQISFYSELVGEVGAYQHVHANPHTSSLLSDTGRGRLQGV